METYLIKCCAPTLAGKKVANMFTLRQGDKCIKQKVFHWNEKLRSIGLKVCILKQTCRSGLIYVYREEMLKDTLNNPETLDFLHSLGYSSTDINSILNRIKNHFIVSDEFPHEIGLLLGYPIRDVKGFIENKGKCFRQLGHWKVYDDTEKACKLFNEYNHCQKCFMNLYLKGYNCFEIIEKFKSYSDNIINTECQVFQECS